jgi:hypothetical protein
LNHYSRYIKISQFPFVAHLCAFAVHVDNGKHPRWQPARRYALTARCNAFRNRIRNRIHVILTSVADPDPDSLGSVDPESGSRSVFSLKCWVRIRIKGIRMGNADFNYVKKNKQMINSSLTCFLFLKGALFVWNLMMKTY